jgi:acyl-CoA reductase-like NAD-dependent aldehyde dehydrogenase
MKSGFNVEEEYKLLIGGEWVSTSDHYDVIDPNTTEVVGHAPEASRQQAIDAAAAARTALRSWRATPMAERCALLAKAADVLEARLPALAGLVQAETGSTITVAETMQLSVPIERLRYYQQPREVDEALMPYAMRASALGPGGIQNALVHRQPAGVVACITPYNFPITSVAGKVAPALAMGNTVVIKPAPQDPLAVIKFVEILDEVGFPAGVINLVVGSGPEAGSALVDSKLVNMISFTGSSVVGVRIVEQGAKTMKRNLMELGGKGPLIMTADCDVAKAVSAAASAWAFHSGQICTAPTRVIVHRSIYEKTVEMLVATAKALKVGDARLRDTVVGPLVTKAQRDRVVGMIERGVAEGATVACGGGVPDRTGYFVDPTLLVDVKPDDYVVQEEFFGPVVVAVAFDDEDEAVEIANRSDYGLFAYVFCGDLARGLAIAEQLESGTVVVNGVQPHLHAAFGGFKMSGIGRDRGVFGLHAYSEIQTVNWPTV